VIDQVRGALGHATTAAARTERPPLARERDEPVEAAVAAAKPREPARERPALEELPKRPLDESRPALIISPLLVPSKSPLNCLATEFRPTVSPSTFSSFASCPTFTSKVPSARPVIVVPF
jgi:hypothetical protein